MDLRRSHVKIFDRSVALSRAEPTKKNGGAFTPPQSERTDEPTNLRTLEQELHRHLTLRACFEQVRHAVARIVRALAFRRATDEGVVVVALEQIEVVKINRG